MKDDYFFHIRSSKFPILPGEDEELVNPGMYGKSLSLYLQEHLQQRGWAASWINCQDWGWWVGIEAPLEVGVCIYNCTQGDSPNEYVVCDGMLSTKKWSFRSFSFIDYTSLKDKLKADILEILSSDPEIEFLGIRRDMP
jgi:hypothetical protein